MSHTQFVCGIGGFFFTRYNYQWHIGDQPVKKKVAGLLVLGGGLCVLAGFINIINNAGMRTPGADLIAVGLMAIFVGMWICPRVG